ncbi:MAG TPA: M23 family metallopeptidase, partial [Clostridia bacterium]
HKTGKRYTIDVSAGNASKTFDVELRDKEFIIQYLTIDPKVSAETRNDKSAQEVVEKVDPLRPVCDPEKYWEGTFIQPVEGGRVSPKDFGKRRYVNNAPTSYRHNGLDIGHDEGTPVKAINNGRVLLAEYLIGTGYTVIIEHGYGLKSWYYHMVELNTEKDAMVKKGDIIGYVGSTGFSTGPHLHLSISVNNVYVNPMPFFENGVPLQ